MTKQELQHSLMNPIRLSVAAPAYNEAACLYEMIAHWRAFLLAHTSVAEFEIVICNDGSQDETALILDYLQRQFPEVRPVHLPVNQGASVALTKAIQATKLDWVLLTDADEQFPIENFNYLLTALRSDLTHAVIGIRQKKASRFARIGSKISGTICGLLHGVKLRDFNSACKLVWGPALRSLLLEAKGMNYSTEITSRLLENKISLTEINIEHHERATGASKIKWFQDSYHRLLFVIYIAFRQLLFKLDILKKP